MNLKLTNLDQIQIDHAPITCEEETSLSSALKIMNDHHVGSIIVTQNKSVVGIFTERDFLRLHSQLNDQKTLESPIKNFMTKDVKTLGPKATIHQCLVTMRVGKFRHIVIVDDDNQLSNVLSIRDALNFLCDKVVYKDVI